MVDLNDIHPLTDFNRHTKKYVKRLKQTGKPEVLTLNGEANIVVQSAEGYQKLLKAAELSATLAGIQRGLDQTKRGEGRPMRAFLKELAAKHGFPIP